MLTGSDTTRFGFPGARILLLAGAFLVCAACALVFFAFDPTKVALFPPCAFHQLTGLDCPGCGAQRALHQLLHGHLLAALRLNAMFVLSLPLCVWLAPRFISSALTGRSLSLNERWLWLYLGAWIAFGLLRNVPLPLFHWFAA
jgi:hypothetical protein